VRPPLNFLNFCETFCEYYSVYVCIDDNSYDISLNANSKIIILKIDSNECENAGFKDCVMYVRNKACSRDKALYYFCKNNIEFNNIWFIEEDVFIPNVQSIINMDTKYNECDLICSPYKLLNMKHILTLWHLRNYIENIKFKDILAKCMICAIRINKKMLYLINKYAEEYKTLFMDEFLFPTIAFHNKLKIVNPIELKTIVFKRNWTIDSILNNPTNLFHPIKNIDDQIKYREQLNSNKKIN
jgi:hypothetical protein